MKRLLMTIAALLAMCVSVQAQEVQEDVVSWDVLFLAAGADPATAAPVQSATFLRADSTCGQATVATPTETVLNPTEIRVTDPADPTKDCILGPNASGTLISVPIGQGYVAVAVAHGATKTSARSVASNPFDRALVPVAPAVPTRITVVRGGGA